MILFRQLHYAERDESPLYSNARWLIAQQPWSVNLAMAITLTPVVGETGMSRQTITRYFTGD
jgi:hypothetical protein